MWNLPGSRSKPWLSCIDRGILHWAPKEARKQVIFNSGDWLLVHYFVFVYSSSWWPPKPSPDQGSSPRPQLHPVHSDPRSGEVRAGGKHQHLDLPIRDCSPLAAAATESSDDWGMCFLDCKWVVSAVTSQKPLLLLSVCGRLSQHFQRFFSLYISWIYIK